MSMSAIASPRLGIGPLIRVNTSVSSVLFSSRKRSCWLAGWCGLQMALKPWPFHVPKRPARAPSGSGPAASALIASVACASGVASPANAKSGSVCVPAVMMTPSRISSRLAPVQATMPLARDSPVTGTPTGRAYRFRHLPGTSVPVLAWL